MNATDGAVLCFGFSEVIIIAVSVGVHVADNCYFRLKNTLDHRLLL